MIKYLGSKRVLLPVLTRVIAALQPRSVADLFSGTSRVGHALKKTGVQVFANDHNAYAATLARCYVQADAEDVLEPAAKLVEEFNRLPGAPGYFTETFCEKSRFFQPRNGARVDAIREAIAAKGLDPELEAVMLISLMEAADRVDSTTGVQMAYLKSWAARAHQDLELRVPAVLPHARNGKSHAYQLDALEAVEHITADLAYLDPPYNQHKYLGNYHIWETLVRWDAPQAYGIACKRVDCRTRTSPFNSKVEAKAAMAHIIRRVQATHLVVSFNNEGFLAREDMENLLRERGEVLVIEEAYKRYVGAQIGIYNPGGSKVGKIGHLHNKEYIFVASPDPAALARISAELP